MLHFVTDMRRPAPMPILPPGWTETPGSGPVARDSRTYVSAGGLCVIHSIDLLADGSEWDHVSVSRRDRIPAWSDLVLVKEFCIGPEREALQLLPKRSEYVNLCKRCLHLWARHGKARVMLKENAA